MNHELLELDRVEWRVLGALRFVDAVTGVPVDGLLDVDAGTAVLQRNRRNLYVIRAWPPLAAANAGFETQEAVATQALAIEVRDPAGRYLPRRASVTLPRDADPAHATSPGSLFRPVDLALYPAAAAPVGANWSVLRVSLTEQASGDALGGALVQVSADGKTLARGLTDVRGEALVCVVGVPLTTFSSDPGAVVINEIQVQVLAVFDPARGTRTPSAAIRAGRVPATTLADPDALAAGQAGLPGVSTTLAIAARRQQALALQLSLP